MVPAGASANWQHDPFGAHIDQDILYGRGAADMKAGLAALVCAALTFVERHPSKLAFTFLITSDEEGPAKDGTARVIDEVFLNQIQPKYCLIGEPSSSELLGDTIKNGRRGSLNAQIEITGKMGHIAYPQFAINPIHQASGAISDLHQIDWADGDDLFEPTNLQISNIVSGTGTTNVIPAKLTLKLNVRFNPNTSAALVKERIVAVLAQHNDYSVDWHLSGEPFVTKPGALTNAASAAIKQVCGYDTKLSTNGGTSDGRFIAKLGCQILELGLQNKNSAPSERVRCCC